MMTFLKALVFFPMMFLRGVLQWVFRVCSGLTLLGSIGTFIAIYGFDVADLQWYVPWILIGSSFCLFLVSWYYDVILLKLNPNSENVLILD